MEINYQRDQKKTQNSNIRKILSEVQCNSELGKLNIIKLQSIQSYCVSSILNFEEHPTTTPHCTQIFDHPSIYYSCLDCKNHNNSIICEPCFLGGNHKGHRFTKKQKLIYGSTDSCDCGNQFAWKKSGFCKNHGLKMQEIEINQSESKYFLGIFKDLFLTHLTLIKNEPSNIITLKYRQSLYNYLIKLNSSSRYYNKLTKKLFDLDYQINQSIILALLKKESLIQFKDILFFKLIIKMLTEKTFKYELTKNLILCFNELNYFLYSKLNRDLIFQIMLFSDVLDQLADKQNLILFPKNEISDKYLFYLDYISKNQEIPYIFWKKLIQKNVIIDHYLHFSKYVEYWLSIFKDQKQQILNIIHQLFSIPQKLNYQLIIAILVYWDWQISKIDLKLLIFQIQFSIESLYKHLKNIFLSLLKENDLQKGLYIQVSSLLLIQLQQQNVASQIWEQNLQKSRRCFHEMDKMKDIYNYFKQVSLLSQLMVQNYSYGKIALSYGFNSQQIIQRQSQLLKNYLSVLQVIKENQLKEFIFQRIGKFDRINFILKENVIFEQISHVYKYQKHQQKDIRTVLLFKNTQHITIWDQIKLNQIQKLIIDHIFNNNFFEIYSKFFQQFFQSNIIWDISLPIITDIFQKLLKSILILSLVKKQKHIEFTNIILKLTNKQNKRLMNFIKKSDKLIKIYQNWFHIKIQKQSANDNLIEKLKSKEKFNKIKNQKFEEMRKKQMNFKVENNLIADDEKQSQKCLFCHQDQSQNNCLYNFGIIYNIFLADSNKKLQQSHICLRICSHQSHLSCFMTKYGNFYYFICPLCKNICNNIFPANSQQIINNSQWKIRTETILSTISNNLDKFSFFSFFLFAIINNYTFQSHYCTKTSKFLKNHIKKLYLKANERQKQLYTSEITKINHQINTEKNQMLIIKKQIAYKIVKYIISPELNDLQQIDKEDIFINNKQRTNKIKLEHLPQTIEEFLQSYQTVKCQWCQKISNKIFYCSYQKLNYCQNCLETLKKQFNVLDVFIDLVNAEIYLFAKGKIIIKQNLYENQLRQPWNHTVQPTFHHLREKIVQDFHSCLFNFEFRLKNIENNLLLNILNN